MAKNVQTLLLLLVFVVFGAVGYFLGEIISGKQKTQMVQVEEVVVEPEILVSRVPVAALESAPVRAKDGSYSFSISAVVDSEEPLKYILYSDDSCKVEITSNLDGVFVGVPPIDSRKYYALVQNIVSKDCSEVITLEGFVRIIKVKEITGEELEALFNVDKNYDTERGKAIVPRLASNYMNNTVVIGQKEGERKVHTLQDVCNKVRNGDWTSATVEALSYNESGRLVKMTIRANY